MKKIFSLGIAIVSIVFILFGCSAFDEERGNGFPCSFCGESYVGYSSSSSSSYLYSSPSSSELSSSSRVVSSSSSISTVTLPSTPTGVSAVTNSESSITVSWTSVSGTTGYYIYRSESADGTYSQVGSSTTTSYTNSSGLLAGTTYYYKVAAYNDNGTGSQSSYVQARTKTMQCDNQIFNTIIIGTQTWMAENLNCNVSGSKCYGDDASNCTTYGRLYDWVTAMNLDVSCNSSSCSGQVASKHQGICPNGWHIPSNEDWETLENYVGGSSTAGRYLKAISGWPNCGPYSSGNYYLCEDSYSFAALPGGSGDSNGNFSNVGNSGYWWSAFESGAHGALDRYMGYLHEYVITNYYNKSNLQSVRCVMD